jgi:hypothetical protein
MKMMAKHDVAPSNLVKVYRRFRGLHHQGDEVYHSDDGSRKDL